MNYRRMLLSAVTPQAQQKFKFSECNQFSCFRRLFFNELVIRHFYNTARQFPPLIVTLECILP